MVKLTLSPDIATVRNLLGLIQKALVDKPTDGSVVGNLLNMINMWVDSVPTVLENQEALNLVFQYRSTVIKNWVDVSTNRSLLDQSSSIIGSDCQGFENPPGLGVRVQRVGVRVGNCIPLKNPYP